LGISTPFVLPELNFRTQVGLLDSCVDICVIRYCNDDVAVPHRPLESRGRHLAGITAPEFRPRLADVVEGHWCEVLALSEACKSAKIAMESTAGEPASRKRAEAVRSVIHNCKFVATGRKGSGPGSAKAKLVEVTFNPVASDARAYEVTDVL
jgi:hypothetical protein